MSEESISLRELLDLSIGSPHPGAVNFTALHELLHAVLTHLGIRERKVGWQGGPAGQRRPELPEVSEEGRGLIQQDASTGEQRHDVSPPARDSGTAEEAQWGLQSRIQICEDGVTRAVKLVEELRQHRDDLRGEVEELRQLQVRPPRAPPPAADPPVSQKSLSTTEGFWLLAAAVGPASAAAVERCCHRVDAVEEALTSLRDTFQKYPDPEELSRSVTWDMLQSSLLSQREMLQQGDVQADMSSVPPKLPQLTGSGADRYPETVEALRNLGQLREAHSKLDGRVAALEEGKVDQAQLAPLRELISCKGSQEVCNNLALQLSQQRDLINSLSREREKDMALVDEVQRAVLQLQAECEKLHESNNILKEDSRWRQIHIEELHRSLEHLEEEKADKRMVETEIKADKSALDSKVSQLQFDSMTEQLNAMFHELLSKVAGQEQDWDKVVHKLSAEMECKLNRLELDSVRKQLEDRWRKIHDRLQAQAAPEHEDAAGIRKQLVDRFHCLSCDRPVVMHAPGSHLVTLPSSPGFPSHKSIRPYTVYGLEHLRQHSRSERVQDVTDYSHLAVPRSCGGSHTVTSTGQRRPGLHHMKHQTQAEVDATVQEEVDIIGMDGHIYRGRLNAPSIRKADTKLPTIATKDGATTDKVKSSRTHRAPTPPEPGHGALLHHARSAKSGSCSRSASSSSGHDWPVSVLGCTSQSSVAQESGSEPQEDRQLHL
ncbi:glutamine-rich protein 2 [Aulostomus maculatus]